MNEYRARIREIELISHNVKRFVVEKPKGYSFIPGQSTKIKIDGYEKTKSFTMTSLEQDIHLEFLIKIYNDREGFTKKIGEMNAGDEITIEDASGNQAYKEKGIFIAAGTGITPFIAISRQLRKDGKLKGNQLIFSNKTYDDVFNDEELKDMFRDNYFRVLTREEVERFYYGRIDEEFLREKIKDIGQYFYLCGPKIFCIEIRKILEKIGVESDNILIW